MDRNQVEHGSLMALSCMNYPDSFQARLTSRATFLRMQVLGTYRFILKVHIERDLATPLLVFMGFYFLLCTQ
jgi:hypothetical protein